MVPLVQELTHQAREVWRDLLYHFEHQHWCDSVLDDYRPVLSYPPLLYTSSLTVNLNQGGGLVFLGSCWQTSPVSSHVDEPEH